VPAQLVRRDAGGGQAQVVADALGDLADRDALVSGGVPAGACRGADDITARLAAEVGMLAFSTAFARWATPGNEEPFPPIAHAALRELQDRAAALGAAAGA
jgi:hypothetical protein